MGISFRAMIAPDGTPFLNGITSRTLPTGIEIIGNGTLTHPLDVRLSGPQAAAPELLEALQAIAAREPIAGGTQPKLDRRQCSEMARAAIAKATGGVGYEC